MTMLFGGSAFPVDASDFVESIPLKLKFVVRLHAKLLRFGDELFKIRKGDQARVEHDGRACESHGLIQAHCRCCLEVNRKLTAVVIRHVDNSLVFGPNGPGRFQKVLNFFDGERGLVFVDRKSHAPMIPQEVI